MGLKSKAERWAMGKITGILLGKVAAGDFGPHAKRVYDLLAGHKTQIAAVLALPALLIEALVRSGTCEAFALPCELWSSKVSAAMLGVAGVFAFVGQVDGALRLPAPPPEKG